MTEEKKDMPQRELGKLAVEIRKLEKRLKKIEGLDEEEKKSTSFLLNRIYKIIEGYDVKIIDPTSQKFLEGMTGIDILSAETDKNLEYPIIGDTTTPIVEIGGIIDQRAKVVIKTPETIIEEKHEDDQKNTSEGDSILTIYKKKNLISLLVVSLLVLILIVIVLVFHDKIFKNPVEIQDTNVKVEEIIDQESIDNNIIIEDSSIENGEIIDENAGENIEENVEENNIENVYDDLDGALENQNVEEELIGDQNSSIENVVDGQVNE